MRSFGITALLLATVIVATSAGGDAGEKLFKKYATMKILKSCFGENMIKEYVMKMKRAAEKCKMMPIDENVMASRGGYSGSSNRGGYSSNRGSYSSNRGSYSGNRESYSGSNRDGSYNSNRYSSIQNRFSSQEDSPMLLYKGVDWNSLLPEQFRKKQSGVEYVPIPIIVPTDKIRSKRQAGDDFQFYDGKVVKKLAMKMKAKFSNMTCISKELGYINEDMELNIDYMLDEIRSMRADRELKEDIEEGVTECYEFVNCFPIDPRKIPMNPAIKKLIHFTKCELKNKIAACMKKDLRMKSDYVETGALDDFMDGADEDEKMLAIMWAKAALGGGNEFGF